MNFDIPERLKLTSSPIKWSILLVVGLLFSSLGVLFFVIVDDIFNHKVFASWIVLVLVGFFITPISAWQLIRPGKLLLFPDRFEQYLLWHTVICYWEDVSDFKVIKIGKTKHISFSKLEDEGKFMHELTKATMRQHSSMLRDTYGMEAQNLAELMNAFRNRALAQL